MISKQVIVIRKDLKMRLGKCVAQGSHASLAVILKLMREGDLWTERPLPDRNNIISRDEAVEDWLSGSFTKICVSVNSEEELLSIYKQAEEANLPCALIKDAGRTEFNGVPTFTCCAIGPAWDKDIDLITKKLSLY